MSYLRVIPRDLFNESSLLKCYGRLWILLETLNLEHVEVSHDGEAFDVAQNSCSGNIYLRNVCLVVNGDTQYLERPLNSRSPWPLYICDLEDDDIAIFTDAGDFTPEFLKYIGGQP